ncbi:MAG: N-acetylmuramoyl-L-alanine amidase [Candidatus Marinimicrobia bacterium]|nr:N-acetylmuramoyl-L-alanine amidase [Candidatus Neomarinimicrobiota bacterium]MCF7850210.1 N-acetylmuramoyl-L-alanine amidase [Candidatus Neomarinimicrobiota bacterium]MCF7903748.1 N-acetylmuramoyl-L-alanine amidase [Candidatus Neomarinimicrobiota bacterium]
MKLRLTAIIVLTLIMSSCAHKVEPVTVDLSQLEVVTRTDWGWVPAADSIPLLDTHEIEYVTIHHGGEDFPEDKDVIKYLIGLQSWSRSSKNWMDNPYHYMIDLKGNIYEARPIQYPGDTNTSYDPRGHALICVMGNYENQILSETQFEQLARLTAMLANKYNVPQEKIKSHKDYAETQCPGEDIYRYLEDGSFLERVSDLRTP